MWTFLGLLAAFIVIKFIVSVSRENNKISSQGGIHKKYKEIIDFFLECDPKAKIFEDKYNKVVVGVSGIAGSETYTLFESYNTLHIMCRITNNPLFGNKTIDWDFPESMDPEDILVKIAYDKEKQLKQVVGLDEDDL